MKTLKSLKLFLLAAAVSTLWVGCNKDTQSDTTKIKVRMTDAPGNFQQVIVDVAGVELKINDGTTVNLNVKAGIYNLLDFVNGADTLIANGEIPSGTLTQVRLILGTHNAIMVDDIVYPLSTPSAQQTGLKLNVNSKITAGVDYDLLLDFDANKSVVQTGNGEYQLKPVIRAINKATTGSIHGIINTTLALPAVVSFTLGTATYTTVTDSNGNFIAQGLAEGTYIVTITPQLPYEQLSVENVIVTVGNMTELSTIVFV